MVTDCSLANYSPHHLASDRLEQIDSYRSTMLAMQLNEFQNGNKDQ